MDITYFRSSSYSCYSLCPMQYYLRYVLGLEDKCNIKSLIGTVTHKILEILACQKQNLQNGKLFYEVDDPALNLYKPSSNINLDKNINSIIDSVFNYYKDSEKHISLGSKEYKTVCKYINSALTFRNGIFDPRKSTIVSPETYFDLPIEKEWARLSNGEYLRIRGTMDLIIQITPEIYECVDYKTGQMKSWKTGEEKTFEDFTQDFQLNLYYYALSKLYPHIKQFVITIYHIQFDKPITMAFDASHLIKTEEMIKDRMIEIQNCKLPHRLNTWFCDRVCFYKSKGNTTCDRIYKKIKNIGIEQTTIEESAKNFNLNFYQAPGGNT